MTEFVEQKFWSWKLCTRTESKDYFWIDDQMQPTRKSDFFGCVADQSSQRTGYFLSTDKYTEIGFNNLDAQRKDRFGRSIFHNLLLRSSKSDTQRTKLLREIFAEAICDASKDPVAAVISRNLYNLWEERDALHSSGETWPLPVNAPVIPAGLPSPDSILPGWQYVRNPESLRKFAAVALSRDTDVLLLCAATNPVSRIWSTAASQNIPTAVCAVTVKQDSQYTRESYSHGGNLAHAPRIILELNPEAIGKKLDQATNSLHEFFQKRFWSIVIIVACLSALAFWWYSNSDKAQETGSRTTALQSNDPPNNNALDAQSQETQREASQGVHP